MLDLSIIVTVYQSENMLEPASSAFFFRILRTMKLSVLMMGPVINLQF